MYYGLSYSQLVSGRVALDKFFKDFNYFRAIFFLIVKFHHKSLNKSTGQVVLAQHYQNIC